MTVTDGVGMTSTFPLIHPRILPRPSWVAGWVWLVALLSCLFEARGQTNFQTLVTNGPASNRLNVVFLAEGYTSGQFGKFFTDATITANFFLAAAPFADYSPYINFFAIAVASVQSGSDHPTWPQSVNTYFNSSYDASSDTRITIPAGATGQGKVDALLNTFMPGANLAILLVNDNTPGGSDGGGRTAITATAANSLSVIPVHEAGHVLAGLGDEYSYPYPGYPDTEEPNTTRETNRAAIKWNAWIAPSTPVPTPPIYDNLVGLFEGAHYHATGWYRPKLNCRMGSFFGSFCEVCSEALVLSIYRKVRPLDAFAPVTTNLSVTSPQPLNFTLTALVPATHALNIQWLTNGTPVPGATNSLFSILPAALGQGTKTVSGRITDPTPLVRTDTSNLLSQTLTWVLTVNVPQLQLSAPRWLGGGRFTFRVTGVAPQGFSIGASTNLIHWLSLTTNSLVNGQFDYTNSQGTNFPFRFFRAVTPP